MAGVFLAIGAGQLATLPGSGPIGKWVHLGIGVGAVLLGTAYLATTIALRRRQQGALNSPTRAGPETDSP